MMPVPSSMVDQFNEEMQASVTTFCQRRDLHEVGCMCEMG